MAKQTKKCDVLVVGGGSAGVASAIGAARDGAKVVLVEKTGIWGGKATSANVGTICGAHYRSKSKESKYVSNGFVEEFCELVAEKSKSKPVAHYQGNLHFLPYDPFGLLRVCDFFIEEEQNITPMLHSVVSGVKMDGNTISSVEVLNNKDQITIQPKTVIDCSGEALVSRLAGIKTYASNRYQASAMVFSFENVKQQDPLNLSFVIIKCLRQAIAQGGLPDHLHKISIVPGSMTRNKILLKLSLPYRIDDTPNRRTEVELKGRRDVELVANELINNVRVFKDAHLGFVSAEVGIRIGQLSVGERQLKREDVLAARKFKKDGVAKGSWPIEIWDLDGKAVLQFFDEDDHYDIPAGCLISKTADNLYFAGRNISAEFGAIASARVIGTCLGTGYAAGILASGYVKGRAEENSVHIIRSTQMGFG